MLDIQKPYEQSTTLLFPIQKGRRTLGIHEEDKMVRKKTVRVSDEEFRLLKKYRAQKYDRGIPLGYIIKQLLPQNKRMHE